MSGPLNACLLRMSDEVMVVESPSFPCFRESEDPLSVLRAVYRDFSFKREEEIEHEPQARIVAVSDDQRTDPDPVSRRDYFKNTLDPVKTKIREKDDSPIQLMKVVQTDKYLLFIFKATTPA